jgi:hypothetical protein
MKIKSDYLHEAREDDKRDDARRSSKLRQMFSEQADAAHKPRQSDAPLKEDLKFASLLENSAKLQKPSGQRDEGSRDGDGDRKKDKKEAARDTAENLSGEAKSEKYESSAGGGNFGGQTGLGEGGVNHLNLNENFAARSILHIADLERLVATVRSQITLGGRREIVLQLKRSVLEGLRVRITTGGAAEVGIEFFAASERVRSEIEKHADELAGILRGRGVNLRSLAVSLAPGDENENSSGENRSAPIESAAVANEDDSLSDNTFDRPAGGDGRKYNA